MMHPILCAHLRLKDVADPEDRDNLRTLAFDKLMSIFTCHPYDARVCINKKASAKSDACYVMFIEFRSNRDMKDALNNYRFVKVDAKHEMVLFLRNPAIRPNDNMVIIDMWHKKNVSSEQVYADLVKDEGGFGAGSVHRMIRVGDTVCVQFATEEAYNRAASIVDYENHVIMGGYMSEVRKATSQDKWWH